MAGLPTTFTRLARKALHFQDGRNGNVRYIYVYGGLALAILFPLLTPGYILTVDMVFVPTMPLTAVADSSFPLHFLLHYLGYIVPSWIVQKLLLFLIFIAAGIGAHRLSRALVRPGETAGQWAYYVAGVLYACNPFVYTRFLAGQYLFLLGYAIFPFFVLALLKLFTQPGLRTALRCSVLLTLIAISSLHMLGIAALVAAGAAIGYAVRSHGTPRFAPFARYGSLGILCCLVLNSFWIAPLAFGDSPIQPTVSGFTSSDLDTFSPADDVLPTPLNLLSLYGFWGDSHNLYLLPSDTVPWWLLPILALWGLVAIGIVQSWRRQRIHCLIFAGSALAAVLLASGTSLSLIAPLNTWLFEHIPFFAGYREPQKFLVILIVAYTYFGSMGVLWVRSRISRSWLKQSITVGLISIPVLVTPLLPWGAANQLRTTDYPHSWYEVNDALRQMNNAGDKVLFLPWHLYMPFSFSEGTLANPAKKFFHSPVIISNDPEIEGAKGYAADATVQWLDREVLPTAEHDSRLADKLYAKGIRYVLLAKEFDYKAYGYLADKPGFSVLRDTKELILYHIEKGAGQ